MRSRFASSTRTPLSVVATLLAFFVFGSAPALAAAPPTSDTGASVDVIVREAAPTTDDAETLIDRLGGTVHDHLAIIDVVELLAPSG
jgi:hypothetical protein